MHIAGLMHFYQQNSKNKTKTTQNIKYTKKPVLHDCLAFLNNPYFAVYPWYFHNNQIEQ